jgi:2'-5' RNA ligase
VAAAKRRMILRPRKPEIYSLWLMPKGRAVSRLQTLITALSTKYRTPQFQPHVTLLGELCLPESTAVAMTAQVAERINPFHIQLSEITHLDQYFRCVFVEALKTEALMNAHLTARDVFGQQHDEEYSPHLSLIYGTLTPSTRQHIVQKIGPKLEIEFQVNEIHLYYTAGQPKSWHRVARKLCGYRASSI